MRLLNPHRHPSANQIRTNAAWMNADDGDTLRDLRLVVIALDKLVAWESFLELERAFHYSLYALIRITKVAHFSSVS